MPTLDVSQNFVLPLNTETVQYYRKTGEGQYAAAATVEDCKRRAINKEDIRQDGSLLANAATIWHLWNDRLPLLDPEDLTSGVKVEPKRGDQIVALGITWIVQSVMVQSLGERFRCICIRKR